MIINPILQRINIMNDFNYGNHFSQHKSTKLKQDFFLKGMLAVAIAGFSFII